jgi:hypothetical protein
LWKLLGELREDLYQISEKGTTRNKVQSFRSP